MILASTLRRACAEGGTLPQETDRSSILKVVLLGAGVSIIVLAMREASSILSPFLLAGIIGVCVLPAARWMVRKGVPTWLAMLITIALGVLGVLGLIVLMVVSVNNLVTTLPIPAFRPLATRSCSSRIARGAKAAI